MPTYVKLFSSIIHSTIWREPDHVRLVWVTMLAMTDSKGCVYASVPGLADASRVPVDKCRDALQVLQSPDPDSRDQSFDGRRITTIEGGWELINYPKYREVRSEDTRREQTREAVRRYRQKRRVSPVSSNTDVSQCEPEKATVSPLDQIRSEAEQTKTTTAVALRAPDALAPVREATGRRKTVEAGLDLAADVLFAYHRDRFGHPRAILDDKRRNRIIARLRENGGDVSELLYALDGALKDDWIMGRAKESTKKYDSIDTIFRDRGQVERFLALLPPNLPPRHSFLEASHAS